MADVFTWTDFGRALLSLSRFVPNWLLRWKWPPAKLLARVEAFHFDQPARFHVRSSRESFEYTFSGFNLFNFTPLRLVIVGVDVSVSCGGELFRLQERISAETVMRPFERSGFYIRHALTDSQAARLRASAEAWTMVRITGAAIIRTPHGELRKEVHADVGAIIDR